MLRQASSQTDLPEGPREKQKQAVFRLQVTMQMADPSLAVRPESDCRSLRKELAFW
jgi:hypothetical protein